MGQQLIEDLWKMKIEAKMNKIETKNFKFNFEENGDTIRGTTQSIWLHKIRTIFLRCDDF